MAIIILAGFFLLGLLLGSADTYQNAALMNTVPKHFTQFLMAEEVKDLMTNASIDEEEDTDLEIPISETIPAATPQNEETSPKRSRCLKRNAQLWSRKPFLLEPHATMCQDLLAAAEAGTEDQNETLFSDAASWIPPDPHTDWSVLDLLHNCSQFLETIDFEIQPRSKEEKDFPLAYVFVAHRNAAQTVRLFRMLYQPQNAYCVTYDTKSSEDYKQAVITLVSCFPSNVYLNPDPEEIHYFGYSLLRSVMKCMKVLLDSPVPWRYVQVVSWNDFPLRTNYEMVKIFQILNGSQDSELLHMNTPDYITYQWGEHGGQRRPVPPGGLTWYKGSFASSMTREFIDFTFKNPISVRFFQSLEDSKCAEEFYWPSLVHNIHLDPPGGFPGQCEVYYTNAEERKPFLSRFQVWEWDSGDRKCKGKWTNLSCVYGVRDLGMLLKRLELIAHKVYEESEPALQYCMEEWYWERVCAGNQLMNASFYENLPSVRYHRLSTVEKEKYVCLV